MLVLANVVVGLTIAGAVTAFGYVDWRFSQIRTATVNGLAAPKSSAAPFTLLVVGSDTRALADGKLFGGVQDAGGQRSDTILLVRVVPATRALAILSIPRDLYVPITGIGDDRINTAFGNGPSLLVSTIQTDLGIPIDHYVEVNFDSFRQITDAVGGVSIYFPAPAKDLYSGLNVPSGCVALSGNQALGFARSRDYQDYSRGSWHFQDGLPDINRIHRQQYFVKKMISRAQGQFTNPVALDGIISGVTRNLTVDKGLTAGTILSLARTFRTLDATGISSEALATVPDTAVTSKSVLSLQQPQARAQIDAFNTLGTTTASSPATTAGPTSASPSSVRIQVANGSGVTGQASAASAALVGLGYPTTVDPTPAATAATTVIRYDPSAAAAAAALARLVGGGATLAPDPTLVGRSYPLRLVTGASFTGITSASSSASTPATTASPTTVAPSTTPTTYLLPGAVGAVPAC